MTRGKAGSKKYGKKGSKSPSIEGLERKLAEKDNEIAELKNRTKYMQADFENYKKHIDREKAEFEKGANEGLINELLVIVDDLERATEKIKNNTTKKGIEIILCNLMALLEKSGLKRIEAVGKKFDPYYHEALLSEPSEREDGTVLEELKKGYMLNAKVIRHSKVKIARNLSENKM